MDTNSVSQGAAIHQDPEPILETQHMMRAYQMVLRARTVMICKLMLCFSLLCWTICTKPGCHMYLITMELLGPSVPPVLGPCELSPPNSYLKHAAVYRKHIPPGVKWLIRFCYWKIQPHWRTVTASVTTHNVSFWCQPLVHDNTNCFFRLQMCVHLSLFYIF